MLGSWTRGLEVKESSSQIKDTLAALADGLEKEGERKAGASDDAQVSMWDRWGIVAPRADS